MIMMTFKERLRSLRANAAVRLALLVLGALLLLIVPLVALLPGPGGTVTFVLGLGLVLQSSMWARRQYVQFKRRQPKMGGWADWGLRRASARRRQARERATEN